MAPGEPVGEYQQAQKHGPVPLIPLQSASADVIFTMGSKLGEIPDRKLET